MMDKAMVSSKDMNADDEMEANSMMDINMSSKLSNLKAAR